MFWQQPAVTRLEATFHKVDSPEALRQSFAQRLAEICADKGLPLRGRQTELSRLFKVSQQAAGKWLKAQSYPEMATAVALAAWAGVNVTWLLQGTGPKRGDRVDTKAVVLDEAIRSLPPDLGVDLTARTECEAMPALAGRPKR